MEILGWFVAFALGLLSIWIHYEIIRITSDIIVPWALKVSHSRRVLMLSTTVLMLGHIVEIWIFAIVMYVIGQGTGFGLLYGESVITFSSYLYFSAVSYTSLGYGDILPHGMFRAISVSEALTGLLMIAWSASFTFLKMQQIWDMRKLIHHEKHLSEQMNNKTQPKN